MRKLLIGVLCTIHLCLGQESNMDDFSKSLREFTGSMFDAFKNKEENILFSPTSIAHVLGMLMDGADGQTETQIQQALMVNRKKKYQRENYQKLFKKIYNRLFNQERSKHMSAVFAAKMYIGNEFELNDDYKTALKDYFTADAQRIDFGNAQSAADIINGWISNKTDGMITELIDTNSIDDLTRLVLVNALYFKASWAATMTDYRNLEFNVSGNGPINKPFMGRYGRHKVRYSSSLQEITIPYENDEASMIIAMPTNEKGMKEFSNRNNLIKYLSNLHSEKGWIKYSTNFSMPKFDIEYEMEAKEVLHDMGVRDLFEAGKADLLRISTSEPLHCSSFKHKAKITVNEEGSEAAAATGAVVTGRSISPSEIVINQPFFFSIYRRGHILFFGKVVNPSIAEEEIE